MMPQINQQQEWDSVNQIQDEISNLSIKKLRMYVRRARDIREFSEGGGNFDALPGEPEFTLAIRAIEARLGELWQAKRIALSGLEASSPMSGLSPTVGSSRGRSWTLSMLSKSTAY